MKKYGKLVRDRIPEIIEQSGKSATLRQLDADEFKLALRAKALEEAQELANAGDDELLSELADLEEVIETILHAYDFTRDQLNAARQRKSDERGAFTKRLFLDSASD